MFKESNRIIIVDNEQDDLDKIAREFNLKGIGCRTILYDGINFPEKPYTDVRLAFFDVNLAQVSSDQEKYAVLEDAMKAYISEENGPFVLIFWTSNSRWKDGFIDYVNRDVDNEIRDRIKPYYISIIDKTSISENNTLESLLEKQFGNQVVESCLNFDELLRVASDKAINKLLSIIPNGEAWGETDVFEGNLKKIFAKIAISSWGENNAKDNPDRAINDALIPIVSQSIPRENIWSKFLDGDLFDEKKLNNDSLFKNSNILLSLNNYFHIEEGENINKESRGVVVKLKSDKSFDDSFNMEFDTWKTAEFGDSPNIQNAFPIAVEISAACDYSQHKKRRLKYLMGIGNDQKININKKKNLSTFEDICFQYKGKTMYIALDFNYIFVDCNDSIIDSILFGFKKEMMDMIGSQYANHISRIGITKF